MLTIRPETPHDYDAIRTINRRAFDRNNEARLVETIRKSPGFLPELSLVAEIEGKAVGHILFSPITIETSSGEIPALALAPMAVLPEYQNRGVGSALVRHGLAECKKGGYSIVVVVGHPAYYPRFGFSSARSQGLQAPFPVPDDVFMAQKLIPGALDGIHGTVKYPPAFDDV